MHPADTLGLVAKERHRDLLRAAEQRALAPRLPGQIRAASSLAGLAARLRALPSLIPSPERGL